MPLPIELYFHDNPSDQQGSTSGNELWKLVNAVLEWFGVTEGSCSVVTGEIKIVAGNKVIKAVVMEDELMPSQGAGGSVGV